jgi:hypothetical protein
MYDADAELQAQQEARGEELHREYLLGVGHFAPHRCPPDMPPCPECQAAEEHEDWLEFGDQ